MQCIGQAGQQSPDARPTHFHCGLTRDRMVQLYHSERTGRLSFSKLRIAAFLQHMAAIDSLPLYWEKDTDPLVQPIHNKGDF
jgi:hypothetical protein